MKMKPTLLVAALATVSLATVACDQRSPEAERSAGQVTSPSMQTMQDKTDHGANKVATAADDSAITAKVKAAILAEPGLKSLHINVDTKEATVTLSGNVDSDMLRDRAKQIALSTEGVRDVVNNLSIKPS
jgi:hyperosmotically inducible protein